jgi:hypothetical protein
MLARLLLAGCTIILAISPAEARVVAARGFHGPVFHPGFGFHGPVFHPGFHRFVPGPRVFFGFGFAPAPPYYPYYPYPYAYYPPPPPYPYYYPYWAY